MISTHQSVIAYVWYSIHDYIKEALQNVSIVDAKHYEKLFPYVCFFTWDLISFCLQASSVADFCLPSSVSFSITEQS